MGVVITGGAGFIGSHLAESVARQADARVTVVDDFSFCEKQNLQDVNVRLVKKSVLDPQALKAALEGAKTAYHLAAMADVRENEKNHQRAFEINVQGTRNVLEACRQNDVPEFVFASSSAAYGETASVVTESTPLKPESQYGASKAAGESYVAAYASRYGMKATVLRLANIYGPRSRRGVMFDFFNKLKSNPDRLEILGDGKQTKSYVFVTDAVAALILAGKKQKDHFNVFNVAGKLNTVDEVAQSVAKALHLAPKFEYTGGKTGWRGDVPKTTMNASKLEGIGWKASVGLETGVNQYVTWMESEAPA